MANLMIKISHLLIILLCLSLYFLLFHVCSLRSNNIHHPLHISHHHQTLIGRKALLASEFDFSPFRHHHHHHHHHLPPQAVDGREIDLRYGVEKRLVPTGPNPLHH
ncbi:hypothetical protein Scep_022436 [Stephania cephalantha]|uniref:CLAVATA3/ESR (CLE)-related protein 13 n=1 Tax=Stephania cephalantha TaxID=152367 RepID=A0AAP0F813_9MAGN